MPCISADVVWPLTLEEINPRTDGFITSEHLNSGFSQTRGRCGENWPCLIVSPHIKASLTHIKEAESGSKKNKEPFLTMFGCNNYGVITVIVRHVMLEVGQAPDSFERLGYKWNKNTIFEGILKKKKPNWI